MATKLGTNLRDVFIILCDHYDSIAYEPCALASGVNDNAAGVDVLMKVSRVLNDLRLISVRLKLLKAFHH